MKIIIEVQECDLEKIFNFLRREEHTLETLKFNTNVTETKTTLSSPIKISVSYNDFVRLLDIRKTNL